MKKFAKVLALCLALVMVIGCFAACGKDKDTGKNDETPEILGMSDSPLAAPEVTKDFEIKEGFKIGFICLHDENSTYDKNFLDGANAVIGFDFMDKAVAPQNIAVVHSIFNVSATLCLLPFYKQLELFATVIVKDSA